MGFVENGTIWERARAVNYYTANNGGGAGGSGRGKNRHRGRGGGGGARGCRGRGGGAAALAVQPARPVPSAALRVLQET